MTAFFIYLLKVSGWIAAGWLIYYFFLRNEKFYNFNRAYLMTGLAVAFLIPLVKIHYPVKVFMAQASTAAIAENIQMPVQQVDIYSVLFYIYIFCIVFLIIRQLFLLLKIRALIRSAGYTVVDNFRLVHSIETKITFSFFNYIFLNFRQTTEVEQQLILAHERSHIFQHHWIDLAFAESACIFLWFNPFAWIYLRSVKENHEYLADEAVIRNGYSPVFYRAALINQSFNASVFPLVNSFSHYKFKRIAMMKKETSNPLKKLAVMLLIPAAGFFFWAFAEPEYNVTAVESVVCQKDTVKIHGNTIVASLIIVDGKESSLNEINSDQIESVSVLKNESAVKVYGEKGKNGVVIITTKKTPPVATTLQVSGTVTDAKDDKPLSGVIVLVKGSTTGAVTDLNGKYSLNIPADAVLQFSYINMVTKEVPVLNGKIINIAMNNAETQTNDTIHANITVFSSKSGENARPLFVVDGKETESIANLSAEDIESITVLKDLATAKYGDKGRNGVVIITTKK